MKNKNQVKSSPIIGISATLLTIESGSFMGRERTAVGHDYIQAVESLDGIPFVLPVVKKKELIQRQIEMVDGLLLSGGYDVCPLLYGEEPKRGLEAVRTERDKYEIELVHMAHRLNKPIFGICRGLQLLNVAFGGTLYQDINLDLPSSLQHSQRAKPEEETHTISILSDTLLHKIMNTTSLSTNSFHHQAIKDIASGLVVNAHAKDGVIEGIEGDGDLFILGVQWHPEHMIVKHPKMLKLFHAFVEAANKRRVS